ncbi:hypothetical protein Tco_0760582, partial [Tanacetum coccineum]
MKEDEADDVILLPALDNGAFLTVKRKLTNDFVINARQHLIRERIQKFRNFRVSVERETKEVESTNPSYRKTKVFAQRKKENIMATEIRMLNFLKTKEFRSREALQPKNAISVEWTKELHSKFLSVVQELGEGKIFPTVSVSLPLPRFPLLEDFPLLIEDKDYSESKTRIVMFRMYFCVYPVYLEDLKCRHGWQFAHKRGTPSSSSSDKISSNYSQYIVKFGHMPPVATHVENPKDLVTQTDHATYTKSKGKLDVNLKNNNSFGDSSFINYCGLGNIEPIYPRPSIQYGSVDHNFPPKQASADLFDFLNGTKGDATFSGTQLHPIELNDNYKLEQVSQDDGQELPNE